MPPLAIYKTPTPDFYLRADGLPLSKLAPGEIALDPTPDVGPQLASAFVGGALQLASTDEVNLIDYGGDIFGWSLETREALKLGAEFLDTVVLVYDAFELGLKIAQWMGGSEEEADPIITLLTRIDARLRQIEDTTLKTWASLREDNLTDLRALSTSALRTAQEYLEAGRPKNDPVKAARAALADRDSLVAVQTFTSKGVHGGYWLRPDSLRLTSTHGRTNYGWMDWMPDRPESSAHGQVWDYRWALPAMMYAVVVRVAVLKAVSPESLGEGRAGSREIRRYASFLRAVSAKMQEGIRVIDTLSERTRSEYGTYGRAPVAAIDIHSGHGYFRLFYGTWSNVGGTHPWISNLDPVPALADGTLEDNVRRLARYWWGHVWHDIGMPELCTLIADLDSSSQDRPWSIVVREVGMTVRSARAHTGERVKAQGASALAALTATGDAAVDAARTFHLYEALRDGSDEAQVIVRRCVDDLTRIDRPRALEAAAVAAAAAAAAGPGYVAPDASPASVVGPTPAYSR
jgi:hypothetical protein